MQYNTNANSRIDEPGKILSHANSLHTKEQNGIITGYDKQEQKLET